MNPGNSSPTRLSPAIVSRGNDSWEIYLAPKPFSRRFFNLSFLALCLVPCIPVGVWVLSHDKIFLVASVTICTALFLLFIRKHYRDALQVLTRIRITPLRVFVEYTRSDEIFRQDWKINEIELVNVNYGGYVEDNSDFTHFEIRDKAGNTLYEQGEEFGWTRFHFQEIMSSFQQQISPVN